MILVLLQALQPTLHTSTKSMALILRLSSLNLNPFSAISNSLSLLMHLFVSRWTISIWNASFSCVQAASPAKGEFPRRAPACKTGWPQIGTTSLSKHSSHMSRKLVRWFFMKSPDHHFLGFLVRRTDKLDLKFSVASWLVSPVHKPDGFSLQYLSSTASVSGSW